MVGEECAGNFEVVLWQVVRFFLISSGGSSFGAFLTFRHSLPADPADPVDPAADLVI